MLDAEAVRAATRELGLVTAASARLRSLAVRLDGREREALRAFARLEGAQGEAAGAAAEGEVRRVAAGLAGDVEELLGLAGELGSAWAGAPGEALRALVEDEDEE